MSATLKLEVELSEESSGYCDCCGRISRTIWGSIHGAGATVATYFVQWTEGHLEENGANFDLIIGPWGDNTSPEQRAAVSLLCRTDRDGGPAFMVIDAQDRPMLDSKLVGLALSRDEVVGTPLATQVFAILEAIWLNDSRLFHENR